MKRILFASVLLFSSLAGFSQPCTPNAPTGNPGVFPAPDNIPCIERNVPYDFTMQTENFDSLTLNTAFGSFTVSVDWLQIDSIENFPCGITWQSDSLQYSPGETGCIRVSGTSLEPVGQYPVGIYVSIQVSGIPLVGTQVVSGELKDLAAQGGFNPDDYNYVSRVVNQGDPCPARDTAAAGVAADGACPSLGVSITGVTVFCTGTEDLTAVASYELGAVSYMWSGGETTQTITVSTSGTYSVTVTDQNGTATASVTVSAGQSPTAGFTSAVSGLSATFTNTSTLASSYAWDFGDGGNSTATSPSHTYGADGTYDVTLTATNACGSDTYTESVTVVTPPCIANAPTGNPGISPGPNAIPCVERHVPYDFTMQVENFDTLNLNTPFGAFDVPITSTRIDSVTNLPCGLTWEADRLLYAPGETGCIRVSGTSKENEGQYPVRIYMTMSATVPVLGPQTISGELNTDLLPQLEALAGSLGYDFKYVSRVIEQGANCPARDTTSDSDASGPVCPPFSVAITGSPVVCPGQPATLTADAQYETGTVTYLWSDNTTSPVFTTTTQGTVSVTVTDQTGTATNSISVTTGTPPTANFSTSLSGGNMTTTNTSSNASTFAWNFGDTGSGSANTSTQQNPSHTYGRNGTYTVRLIATNACGSDTLTKTVTVIAASIAGIDNNLVFKVYPNPSAGFFNVGLNQEASAPTTLYVHDVAGKVIYHELITGNGNIKKQLNLSALPKGVYALRLNSEQGNGIQRLMIY